LAASVLLASTAATAGAADPQPPNEKSPPAATTAPAGDHPKLLPEVNVKDVPLTDLIDLLRDVDPTFQAVVSYEPGATRGQPQIQELRLRNVSVESVMKLLSESYPQINIGSVTEDGTGKVWTIRVSHDQRQPSGPPIGRPGGQGLFGGESGGGGGGVPVQEAGDVTAVFRLREIVDDLAPINGGAAGRKSALESIVSLVQTTLETGGASKPGGFKGAARHEATLKLHEGTETLIFHGSSEQSGLVVQALDTLQPRSENNRSTQAALNRLTGEINRLGQQVHMLEGVVGINGSQGNSPAAQTRPAATGAEKK
jgi:hypothetical protein